MAETLLALLLVTTSAKGANLVFRWPEIPTASSRLARARPQESDSLSHLDNPWKASHPEHAVENAKAPTHDYGSDPDYCWQRPNALRDRSLSFRHSSHLSPGRASPARDRAYSLNKISDEYDHLLGYSVDFLATLLCPQRSMCHQKFELVVDDLAFVGHPVCADVDGDWRFKPEKFKAGSRGRETGEPTKSASPHNDGLTSMNPEILSFDPPSKSAWLHTFHFALVLDLPDPSSSASGNLSKYFNILYEQIAFTLAAVLYQEQVLSNFVEKECDVLSALKESCISKGEPFSKYVSQAFEVSSIAPAMKSIYEAIKNSKMAYVSINNLPLELQLPPFLDSLLDSQDDPEVDLIDPSDNDEALNWGEELSLGWKLPTMAPWKSLLLLDVDNEMDPYQILGGPHDNLEDKALAEGLVRFLQTATVTLSLSGMANMLDWDLESQVYPIVRWLVLHRRAKVVDTVHPGLKTVFTLPPKFGKPLSQLTPEFQEAFSHPSIPPLPRILATVSTSMSKQTDNHFFASVVQSKELIPMYHDVVLWMLKRDMLVALHLRIRLVATSDLKARVKDERDRKLAGIKRDFTRRDDGSNPRSTSQYDDTANEELSPNAPSKSATFFLSPKTRIAGEIARSKDSDRSGISELNFGGEGMDRVLEDTPGSEVDSNSEPDEEDSGWDTTEDHIGPSMIDDPGKATPMQRRWLSAMSEGKEPAIARRFERINQYFDGKKSDDEILYRAKISRRQLREVLHHYEEYLQTFLHPS